MSPAHPHNKLRIIFSSTGLVLMMTFLALVFPTKPVFAQNKTIQQDNFSVVDMTVIGAGSAQLTGGPALQSIQFEANALQALQQQRFKDEGFRLNTVLLVLRMDDPEEAGRTLLSAQLEFSDPAGRQASTLLTTTYSRTTETITIHSANATTIFQTPDRIVPYFAFVKPEQMKITLFRPDTGFLELADFVKQNALTAENLAKSKQDQSVYYLFTFFSDRISPNKQLELRISSREKGGSGEPLESWEANDQGWRILVAKVALKKNKQQFLKTILISTNKKTAAEEEIKVGVISTDFVGKAE